MTPRSEPPDEPGPSDDELLARFQDIVGDADLDALRGVAAAVLGLAADPSSADPRTAGPSASDPDAPGFDRRRPAPAVPALLTLRVELEETDVWRLLELRGDLPLDVVHEVLQDAMGWTDSHLHQFAVGDGFGDPTTQRFVTREDLEEGEDGVPEAEVRLDELLQDVGDTLRYTYDFGDGWDHVLRVEAVAPLPDDAPAARCTGGRLACPPEDCGGTGGYEQLVEMVRARVAGGSAPEEDVFGDPDERWEWAFGDLSPAQALARIEHFDPAETDLARTGATTDLPAPVADLMGRLRRRSDRATLLDLVLRAQLTGPVLVDAELAAAHVEPYRWFLQHVGGGLTLTSAGYLRPADVEATARALGIEQEWIGTLNREVHTLPVLSLRETLRGLGLVRVLKGRLLPTRAGAALRDDPVGLWWHVVGRLPLERKGFARDAALLALLNRAGGGSSSDVVVSLLQGLGWVQSTRRPVTADDVVRSLGDTEEVLRRMGVLPRGWRRDAGSLHPGLQTVARAALQRWP